MNESDFNDQINDKKKRKKKQKKISSVCVNWMN